MFKSDYKLWLDYHNKKIDHELTEKEKSEIRASEFAMNLLVPADHLVQLCEGYENLLKIWSTDIYFRPMFIDKIAKMLLVPYEVVFFKMQDIVNNYKSGYFEKTPTKVNDKILKKEKNITFVNFKK